MSFFSDMVGKTYINKTEVNKMKKLTYEMIDNKAVEISSYLEYLIIIEALAEGVELKFNIFGDVFDNNGEWFGNLIELE